MDLFSQDNLDELLQVSAKPCISLYVPMVKKGRETRQNPIRFRNVLQSAQSQLERMPAGNRPGRGFLAPLERLSEDNFFLRNQEYGLAAFLAPDFLRTYRLDLAVPEIAVVNERFHIKPLLPLTAFDMTFFVLTFSQKGADLYRGTRQALEKMEPAELPKGMAEALQYDSVTQPTNVHIAAGPTLGGAGRRMAIYHGHSVSDQEKDFIARYCRVINNAIMEYLQKDKAPLVLGGLEFLLPIYRDANTYPDLLAEGIAVNPADLTAEELHHRAWQLLTPLRRRELDRIIGMYNNMKGTGKTACEIESVIKAAAHGRVGELVLALDRQQWGRFDADGERVVLHEEQMPGDLELLDLAARLTLDASGRVFPVPAAEMPDRETAVAVLRY